MERTYLSPERLKKAQKHHLIRLMKGFDSLMDALDLAHSSMDYAPIERAAKALSAVQKSLKDIYNPELGPSGSGSFGAQEMKHGQSPSETAASTKDASTDASTGATGDEALNEIYEILERALTRLSLTQDQIRTDPLAQPATGSGLDAGLGLLGEAGAIGPSGDVA